MMTEFMDRHDAGRQLGVAVRAHGPWADPLVLGLPRGGVPVAAGVARALDAPLDVLVVRKLGSPAWPELALGAVAPGGVRWLNHDLLARLGVSDAVLDRVEAQEWAELRRRETAYRGGRAPLDLSGRAALLVDDGLATGATMSAAVHAARQMGAARTVVAVPVAPPEVCEALRAVADTVVCLQTPAHFQAVSQFYRSFPQTTDAEVVSALREATHA
jgi:predicted phosphoribosyltransferase